MRCRSQRLPHPLWGELPLVELLPHAFAITARHARHPVSAERRRTLLVTFSMSMRGQKFREVFVPRGLRPETSRFRSTRSGGAEMELSVFFPHVARLASKERPCRQSVGDGPLA